MLNSIDNAIVAHRFETARRLCLQALRTPQPNSEAVRRRLAEVYRRLADLPAAQAVLERMYPETVDARLEVALALAEIAERRAAYDFYRGSEEARAGLTGDEYEAKWKDVAWGHFQKAAALAATEAQMRQVGKVLRTHGREAAANAMTAAADAQAKKAVAGVEPQPAAAAVEADSQRRIAMMTVAGLPGVGAVCGRIRLPDGTPARDVTVTLGLQARVNVAHPASYSSSDMHYLPTIGPLDVRRTQTDAAGAFRFDAVPTGRHEFLAVTLDPARCAVPTRFLAHGISVEPGQDTALELVADEWRSAPAREVSSPFPATLAWRGGSGRRVHQEFLRNPFYHSFPRELLRMPLPPGVTADPERLLLLAAHAPDEPQPFQLSGKDVLFFADLPERTDRVFALYELAAAVRASLPGHDTVAARHAHPAPPPAMLCAQPDADGRTAVVDTGRAAFRIPWGAGADGLAPLLAVRGADHVWRGQGRLTLPDGVRVAARTTELLESGPLLLRVAVTYTLVGGSTESRPPSDPTTVTSNNAPCTACGPRAPRDPAGTAPEDGRPADGRPADGCPPAATYRFEFTAHAGEAYLLVRETSPVLDGGGFEFSLREFGGGRGYLHWTPEGGSLHWSTLAAQDRELARLQEQTPWWIPPQGFGYAMTADGLEAQDYIGVFTIRRGEWIDREFERIAQGPGDDPPERRELDWPFPEMVGSTLSMITARTDAAGDAFFRFGCFDGERQWGILVSTLARNDGPFKEIWEAQHKNSSPRLQEFKDWRLDEPDHVERPFVVARRAELCALRAKAQRPAFAGIWARITAGKGSGAGAGLRFAVEADPAVAWRKKRELVGVAHIRIRMTLLGREFADMYSPVGARAITPWAEEYDLIAASGVFTPDEERLVRQFLMLMGHMYMHPDFMNWHFNSRNANFEADRVDVVGAIGLVFHGNPDAARFVEHAAALMETALRVYCTPGSGKWYENPACYYLQASKCRMNLAFHLAAHGICDPTAIPRLQDFLRWGILLLTPPCPDAEAVMRDGTPDYAAARKVRRLPPIGDHANLGPWVPDHYALMSKLYRPRDPAFADLLLWAFQVGGSDGGYFGNLPLLFVALDEADLQPAPAQTLASRRLEGFGAVFRGNFSRADEFYLLLKQGPGGYRYHRTEGSIVLFAAGRPLIYDGGEADEAWRHSTLSFHDTHMPLAPGHVERFHSFPALDFSQGVHPVALGPGDAVFLSDDCRHQLVELAEQRYAEPNPADVRTVLWVKDEYVILHDDLKLAPAVPSFWHLQVVAHGQAGSVSADGGCRFTGRFGVDLQVLLPEQSFAAEAVEPLPILEYRKPVAECFAMQHLKLTGGTGRTHYTALLRPLAAGAAPLAATLRQTADGRNAGLHVTGPGIDDEIFLARAPFVWESGGVCFAGRYGMVLRRADSATLALMAGTCLECDGLRLESDGPAVTVRRCGARCELVAEGQGTVRVSVGGTSREVRVGGTRVELAWG